MPQYLTESIKYLFDRYSQAKTEPITKHPVAEYIRSTIPQNLMATGLVDESKYIIDASPGQMQNWAQVPWMGVFRTDITRSAQEGVYIVYLLSADGNSLFLTFNQGYTDIAKDKSTKETVNTMRERAANCIKNLNRRSFNFDENISLGNDLTPRAKMYQRGTIFYKEYQKHNLPSEESLKKDLKDMLEIYEEYYEKIYKGKLPNLIPNEKIMSQNQIFFGAPGTGKSHKIDYDLFKDENGKSIGKGIKEIPENRKFRTTFHPDYDYAQFIGAYKPKKESGGITYSFVPQVFAKAYAAAWKLQLTDAAEANVFLVIEEINRGNCAQIFGDIFQLLDRKNEGDEKGFSQYAIDADCDFAEWLEKEFTAAKLWDAYKKEVGGEGKLKLPPNLNILATMNTSDQSLFPMDSAFKRRFDWEYVPINYSHENANFDVAGDGIKFKWLTFLKKVNADIYKATESEDKQMGEFFIKPKNDSKEIGLDEFRSKVLFYLWDSVYKDDSSFKNIFHFNYPEKDGSVVTFQRLFAKDPSNNQEIFPEILKQMLKNLDEAYKDSEFKDLKILNG